MMLLFIFSENCLFGRSLNRNLLFVFALHFSPRVLDSQSERNEQFCDVETENAQPFVLCLCYGFPLASVLSFSSLFLTYNFVSVHEDNIVIEKLPYPNLVYLMQQNSVYKEES
ncbi:Hypothetical predicted protein [Olea europaea subsp. europaea]|uniref:Uncharacterized protein n=1 Tax=Olea europaea subsp. europaea TaxID=158383 RepID=A0A8S0T580_OLEEU|nr:Hypothetical predicted protein [Olea europaea subsp. europaea]